MTDDLDDSIASIYSVSSVSSVSFLSSLSSLSFPFVGVYLRSFSDHFFTRHTLESL